MIRLMIVDDHELVRMGMRHILDGYPSIKIVAEAGDGETACSSITNPYICCNLCKHLAA